MNEARKVVVKDSPEIAEEVGADSVLILSEEVDTQETMQEVEADEEIALGVEDLPDDELIWPGGPTAGQIKLWKQEYGDVYVTSITYDKHIAWRTLNRLEYKNLVKKMEQLVQAGQLTQSEANLWNEEAITEICILYPAYDKQSLVSEMAGLPSLISQEVLEASGFLALEVRQL
jgi:hypothetical protein